MAGWIGVDFDGTLVEYETWWGAGVYGAPISAMIERVRAWLDKGIIVRIVTARANDREDSRGVSAWALSTFGTPIAVTSHKDHEMIELWDDRARQVSTNTGVDIVAALSARVAELEAEIERERLRLAACGVAALANTEATVADRITADNPYYSASYADVCHAVDREISIRTENARLREALRDYMRADIVANGLGAGCYTLSFIADLADKFGLDPWPSALPVQP